MTNYTTEQKQALTRKMWGFVVFGKLEENSGIFLLIGKIQPNKSAKTFLFAE